jgi:hypothetical protein
MANMNRKIGEWKGGKFVREDDGETELMCLTLHQPLASLMAYGLKRVEGRVWSSDYTGAIHNPYDSVGKIWAALQQVPFHRAITIS